MKIVVVMPAYNEAENIGLMIEELVGKVFSKIPNAQMHLLIVDDYSPDGTGKIVKKYQDKYKNLHLLQKNKEGLGWAYVRGIQHAISKLNADAIIEMDADFQHPPRFVKDMVAAFMNGAEYVIGSRYVTGGSIPSEWEISRKVVSYFGNLFIRLCLLNPKIHDLTTGFRLTKVKGVLDQIDLEGLMELKRFAYKVDLLYQCIKHSKKTVEVPLEFASRTKEVSKFNFNELISTFRVAIILGIKDKEKFLKFAITGFIGYLVNATFLNVFAKYGELMAWILSTEMAIISNFTINNLWTFKDDKISGLQKTIYKFLQFNFTSSGALIIQSILGYLLVTHLNFPRQLALPLIIATVILPYNYFMYTKVIWKKTASSQQ